MADVEVQEPQEASPVEVKDGATATGRRKESVARVRLVPGSGQFQLNGRSLEDYFPARTHRVLVGAPLRRAVKGDGFLTRDPREKERRKYGLKKARKAPQYSKR